MSSGNRTPAVENAVALEHQLITKFGLERNPFSSEIQFFYQGAQRQHNLETLQHLANFGDMVLLLTGDRGAGKTMMLDALISLLRDSVRIVRLSGAELANETTLIARLAAKLEQPLNAKITLSGLLRTCDEGCAQVGRLFIAIDDAHRLPKDLLHVLMDVFRRRNQESREGDNGVVLCLAGEPLLIAQVTSEGVEPEKCRWLYQIQLKPFSQNDLITYLQLRFIKAGYHGELSLSPVQLSMLMDKGKGNPGRINRIATAVLLDRAVADKKRDLNSAFIGKFIAALAVALLLSFLLIAYQYHLFDDSDDVGSVTESGGQQTVSLEDQLAQVAEKAEVIDVNEALSSLEQGVVEPESSHSQLPEPVAEVVVAVRNVVREQPQNVAEGAAKAVVSGSEILEVPVVPLKVVAEKENVVPADRKNNSGVKDVVPTPVAPDDVSSDKSGKLSFPQGKRSTDWMKSRNNKHYTMQVLGSYNETTAQRFIADNPKVRLFYCEARLKGKPWFVVFYGDFANKAEATGHVEDMPAFLRKQKPWIRSFETIKTTLPQ
ncbi:MAG: AAA family ATPase [Hahellaceae bacterium]|nr:AAA family ATPase [Hahellaceae bacterium]MCP5168837.1 AAA family ATPase [Hahellaceae bacterium]